jgi:hypothetical protein
MIKIVGVLQLLSQFLLNLEDDPSAAIGDVDRGPFRRSWYSLKPHRAMSIVFRLSWRTAQFETAKHDLELFKMRDESARHFSYMIEPYPDPAKKYQ